MSVTVALLLAAGLKLDPQIVMWLELDTNAQRLPTGTVDDGGGKVEPPPDDPPVLPIADGLARMDAHLVVTSESEGLVLRSESAAGLKLFMTQASERMIVGQTRASLSTAKLPGDLVLTMSLLAKGRAQLSLARTYAFGRSDAVVDKAVLDWLLLRAGVNGVAFLPYEAASPRIDADVDDECDPEERATGDADCVVDNSISSAGSGVMVGGRALLGPAERLDVLVDAGFRGFPFFVLQPSTERRVDGVLTGVVQLTSARRIFLSLGWLGQRNDSNARGESFTRHRFTGVVGFRLPAQITVGAQAALQLTLYDEGVSVGQAFFLGDDEESQNILEVTLSRPLFGGLYLEARGSVLGNELAIEGARFSRQTAAIGIRAEL